MEKAGMTKVLIIILIMLSTLPLYAYYTNTDKEQFREAAKIMPQNEAIFINTATAQVAFQYYYGEKDNVIGIKNLSDLKKRDKNIGSFWLLSTFTKYSDPNESIKKYM